MLKKVAKIMLLAVLLGAIVLLAGCSGKKASAETVVCAGCGAEIAKTDAQVVGGKLVCAACAEKMMAAEPDTIAADAPQMLICSVCGMKMPANEMVEIEGKLYCPHCVPGEHQTGEQPAEGH
jgi:formylmethanofuran dehydrogenase subunit E